MEIIGYIAALFIGISLGLIGSGGSILTVPLLVYLFGVSPVVATSYSLFIVGSTSLAGSLINLRKGLVDVRTALLFGTSSVVTVFFIRKAVLPLIPETIAIAGRTFSFSILTVVLFAFLMVVASLSMIRGEDKMELSETAKKGAAKLFLYGIGIGLVTGFLGAGGGFLLIPALMMLLRLPIKKAVGTSLLIIALNSLIGFTGDIGYYNTDWKLLLIISAIATVGLFIGSLLSKRIQGHKLKKGFGWFVLLLGVCIIIKEIF